MYAHVVYKSCAFILQCMLIHISTQLVNLLIEFTKLQREKHDQKNGF